MAFVSNQVIGVTTEAAIYTGAGTAATVIGLSIANTSASAVTASARLGVAGAYIVKNAPIPVGGSLIVVGGDQKLVVETGVEVRVEASGTVDVITSALES